MIRRRILFPLRGSHFSINPQPSQISPIYFALYLFLLFSMHSDYMFCSVFGSQFQFSIVHMFCCFDFRWFCYACTLSACGSVNVWWIKRKKVLLFWIWICVCVCVWIADCKWRHQRVERRDGTEERWKLFLRGIAWSSWPCLPANLVLCLKSPSRYHL